MMTKIRTVCLLALMSVITGCGAMSYTKSMFVSGVSLETLGEQFVSITKQITAGCENHAISVPACNHYRDFGENFKKVYPLTVGMWEAAKKAGDTKSQQKAEDVARSLAVDLSKVAVEALGALAPEIK